MKYGIGYRSSIDLDAEQTEARYDQGMLSDIMNDDQVEMQKAESCVADNFKYDHGQKIQRFDPCEICLCIDGEIFCWWKQCDAPEISEILNENPVPAQMTAGPPAVADRPFAQQTQLPATAVSVAVSSSPLVTTTERPQTTLTARTTGKVTTSSSSPPQPPTTSSAVLAVPHSDQSDRSERILHHPSLQNIPQNILLFPQSPPILMHRPVASGISKNATNFARTSSTSNRNKQKGPPKKVKPLHLNDGATLDVNSDKKSYRKSKSKGYSVNYGHSSSALLRSNAELRGAAAVTDRIGPDERTILNDEVSESDGRRLTERMKADGDGEDNNGDDDDIEDDDDDDDEDESDESEEGQDVESVYRTRTGSSSSSISSSGRNSGGSFGGFGYGMIKEPEEDKQQHYIITSSGHVEMFDDTSMDATENAFGTNRLPPQEQQQLASSSTSQPMALVFGGTLIDHHPPQLAGSSVREIDEQSRPIPPLISMTTNVTQYSNYSDRQLADSGGSHGEGLSVASYVLPHATGSVIDVLNSTVEGDYLDDNQTELIYPAVPGSNGDANGSRAARIKASGQPVKTTGTHSVAVDGANERSLPEPHCVVMGVSYKVGSVLKQETGNCLHCVCVAGPENDPVPRVTCTPLNCPPLILPDILDGAGF
ncbi:uncharacterized protein LOC128733674 isoform X2 [Sabethes cyaneus]|nr:uncharacterized protein LOC128733674 isoform X2 [Sabethes cyaneus]